MKSNVSTPVVQYNKEIDQSAGGIRVELMKNKFICSVFSNKGDVKHIFLECPEEKCLLTSF